jgi:hypothetical protein
LHQTPQNKNKNNDESLIMSHSKKYKFFTIKKLLIIFVAPVFYHYIFTTRKCARFEKTE